MTVAEKRAQLEEKGEPWPICSCHGEPMTWHRKTHRPCGGFWECRVKIRETQAARRATPAGRQGVREMNGKQIQRARDRGLCIACRVRPQEPLRVTCARCLRYRSEYGYLGYSTIPLAKGSEG